MSSGQESKIPFIILIPFVVVVFMLAMRSGAPSTPVMPGVVIAAAPVVVAPVAEVKSVPSPETPAVAPAAPATTEAPAEESWK